MKKHVKIYLKFFGYVKPDSRIIYNKFSDIGISCEICGNPANDIHHIEARGMGGSKTKDEITNLMALCRECHIEYGDKTQHKQYLKDKHMELIDHQQYVSDIVKPDKIPNLKY